MALKFEKADLRDYYLKYKYRNFGDLVINVNTKNIYFIKSTSGETVNVIFDLDSRKIFTSFQRENLRAIESKFLSPEFIEEYSKYDKHPDNLKTIFDKYYFEDPEIPFLFNFRKETQRVETYSYITEDPETIMRNYLEKLSQFREKYLQDIENSCKERYLSSEIYKNV